MQAIKSCFNHAKLGSKLVSFFYNSVKHLMKLGEVTWYVPIWLAGQSLYQEKNSQSGEALKQAVQEVGGVTVPGGLQELWRRGTEGHRG